MTDLVGAIATIGCNLKQRPEGACPPKEQIQILAAEKSGLPDMKVVRGLLQVCMQCEHGHIMLH